MQNGKDRLSLIVFLATQLDVVTAPMKGDIPKAECASLDLDAEGPFSGKPSRTSLVKTATAPASKTALPTPPLLLHDIDHHVTCSLLPSLLLHCPSTHVMG